MKLTIESNIRNYDVLFEKSFSFLENFQNIDNSIFIVDKVVYELYKDKLYMIDGDDLFLFNAVETNKTFDGIAEIYDFLISKSVKRNLTIISIGGGITQDITGFVASTLYRGVNWIFVPTTFLAITDSCIGSKTSVNYKKYKNLMGTFYPPSKIYINTSFLETLEKLDFFSGIGETIKFQLMKEEYPKKLDDVLKVINGAINSPETRLDVIHDNMNIKLGYMKGDEFDLGRRNLLNYGHCFGHASETSSEYYVPHGIAVNVGIIFANLISVERGMLSENESNIVTKEICLPNIPLVMRDQDFNADVLLESMKNDKKRVGKYLSVIVPDEEFKMIKLDDVKDEEFYQAFEKLKSILIK